MTQLQSNWLLQHGSLTWRCEVLEGTMALVYAASIGNLLYTTYTLCVQELSGDDATGNDTTLEPDVSSQVDALQEPEPGHNEEKDAPVGMS
jgi:hypothetical protein